MDLITDTINQIDLSKYIMEKQEDDSILLTPFNINNFDIKQVSPSGSLILVPNSNSIEIKSYNQKLHYIIKRFESLSDYANEYEI